MCSEPDLFIEVLKVAPALILTGLVGIGGLAIASRQADIAGKQAAIAASQAEVARARLKLDLFEKRYEVFYLAWGFMSSAMMEGIPNDMSDSKFTNMIPQAGFLFGPEIEDYLRLAAQNWTELWVIGQRLRANPDSVSAADHDRRVELMIWFSEEARGGAKRRFSGYLDFAQWP